MEREGQQQTISLGIQGMKCKNCSAKITKILEQSGAEDVVVDLEQKCAKFRLSQDDPLLLESIKQKIQDASFIVTEDAAPSLSSNEISFFAHKMKCKSCSDKIRNALVQFSSDIEIDLTSKKVSLHHVNNETTIETILNHLRTVLPQFEYSTSFPQTSTPLSPEHTSTTNLLESTEEVSIPISDLSTIINSVFQITGMTCSSCSSKIEESLLQRKGIQHISVNLLLHNAQIRYDNTLVSPDDIISWIQNLGFQAKLISQANNKQILLKKEHKSDQDIQSTEFIIQGMTCASCVANIEESVSQLQGIKSIVVNLMLHHAVVEYDANCIGIRDIISKIDSLGFGCEVKSADQMLQVSEANEEEKRLWRYRFYISLVFCVPIFCISMVGKLEMLGLYQFISMHLLDLAIFVLSIPVHFYAGMHYHISAFKSITHGYADMNVLISLATNCAFVYSLALFLANFAFPWMQYKTLFFETGSMIIGFQNFGKYMEAVAKAKASEAITQLAKLQAKSALLLVKKKRGDEEYIEEVTVDITHIHKNDTVKVLPGSVIPSDGIVVSGQSTVDESMITGESERVYKKKDSYVIGGTMNEDGTILVKISKVGSETMLSQILNLVQTAQTNKAPVQRMADTISKVFVPIVILIAFFTFLLWFSLCSTGVVPSNWIPTGSNKVLFSLLFSMTVLVISCPCALGLATPTAVLVGTGVGAHLGILIKGGEPLEVAHRVNTIVFDKTGTLTQGTPQVVHYHSIHSQETASMLKNVYICEKGSNHPIANSLSSFCNATLEKLTSQQISFEMTQYHYVTIPGEGVKCQEMSTKKWIYVGKQSFVERNLPYKLDSTLLALANEHEENGRTIVWAARDETLYGFFALFDQLKPEAKKVLRCLHTLNIETIMASGDRRKPVEFIANQLGIKRALYEVLPTQKVEEIVRLQRRGRTVAMVGDGINDSIALASADVGVALGAGTEIAMQSADIILVKNDLRDVVTAIDLSKFVFDRIKWNYFWALSYNLICIPLAAGFLYPFFKMQLPPLMGTITMFGSTILVLASSLTLNWYSKKPLLYKKKKREEVAEDALSL